MINKTAPGDINSESTEEILDPAFHKFSELVMSEITNSNEDPLPPDSIMIPGELSPLEIMRFALNSLNIHNWSLFV